MAVTVMVCSVALQCSCGETIPSKSGSLYWTTEELEIAGHRVTCPACEKTSKVRAFKRENGI